MTDVGDNDSLFGSPPSSPRLIDRGRSPSLALPGSPSASAVGGHAVFENVGTIALPGSLHTNSEPLVNLPASPPRPQKQVVLRKNESLPRPITALSQTTSLNLNRERGRASSVAATPNSARRERSKFPKRKTKSATPTPAAPGGLSLQIPEMNGPLPPNFLRSQQALLGLAGIVAGINPAQLNKRSSRGTSAQNPIIVEDEVPSISNSAWKARQSQLPPNLPVPNEDAIVDTLVTQQNIFPVLRSLLQYLPTFSSADVGCCSGTHLPTYPFGHVAACPQETEMPPVKKRKINSVPAGAEDWDVPYPFQGDEGPKGYRQNWQKEREKKLVKELISLIREAVQKAAAKSYVQEKEVAKPAKRSKLEYKPGIYYKSQLPKDSNSTSTSPQDSRQSSIQPLPTPTTTNSQPSPSVPDNDWNNNLNAELEALLASLTADYASNGDNLSMATSMDFSPTVSNSPTMTSSTRLSTPFDFPEPAAGHKENVPSENVGVKDTASATDVGLGFDLSNFDIPIDPALLDILPPPINDSILNSGAVQTENISSNVPYLSGKEGDRVIGNDPFNTDDAGQISPTSESSGSVTVAQPNGQIPPVCPTALPLIPLSNVPPMPSPSPLPRHQSPALQSSVTPTIPATTFRRASQNEGSSVRPAKGVMFLPPVTGAPTKRTLDRDEVLRKAKARRGQLAAEVARAKIELWETTIEQGVLLNLLKDDQFA